MAAVKNIRRAPRAEQTRHCHACDTRRPQTGFKLIAHRRVAICSQCWPGFKPFLDALCGEHAIRLLIATIRLRASVGGKIPGPDQLSETVAKFTAK